MRHHYDTIVVGAGIMGSAAGYYLALAGQRVLLIDAYDPPHMYGSHHGDTRLFRHAYSADPVYVRLALQADQGWQTLEAESGIPLLTRTGVLNMYPADSAAYRGKLASARRFGLDVAALDAEELRRAWPGLSLPDHYGGLYERQGGVLASEACVCAFRALAERHGAATLTHAPVREIALASCASGTARADAPVVVQAAGGVYRADRLLLTAGADCAGLLPGVALPVAKVRKAVAWFRADERRFAAERFPAFNYEGPEGEFYGFPSIAGSGVKVGRHDGGTAGAPGEPLAPFGAEPADEAELRAFLRARLPGAAGARLRGAVCCYERTPDEHFVLDRQPEHEHVYMAVGFSGHGFKFAPAIGALMCEWITTGRTREDLSFFSLRRFR